MTSAEWAKTDKPMTCGKWLSREGRILADLAVAEERAVQAEAKYDQLVRDMGKHRSESLCAMAELLTKAEAELRVARDRLDIRFKDTDHAVASAEAERDELQRKWDILAKRQNVLLDELETMKAERDRLRAEVEETVWLVENADLMAFHPFHPGRGEYSKRRDSFLGRQQHGKAT